MIGQGKVEASPMAMASVVASVAAGKSVLPHLVSGQEAESKAKSLDVRRGDQLALDDAQCRHRRQWPGVTDSGRAADHRQDRDGGVRQLPSR